MGNCAISQHWSHTTSTTINPLTWATFLVEVIANTTEILMGVNKHMYPKQRELFLSKVNTRDCGENDAYCLQKRIEKFPLHWYGRIQINARIKMH